MSRTAWSIFVVDVLVLDEPQVMQDFLFQVAKFEDVRCWYECGRDGRAMYVTDPIAEFCLCTCHFLPKVR